MNNLRALKLAITIAAVFFYSGLSAQGLWSIKKYFPSTGRCAFVSFTIGANGYVATGHANNGGPMFNDLWEYSPVADSWTQKANLPDSARKEAFGFSINNLGYVGGGINGANYIISFWAYDPSSNTWTAKAPYGGGKTRAAFGSSSGGKGYVIGGAKPFPVLESDEVWEYDPVSDTWTQRASFPGGKRTYGAGFELNNKIYFGTGSNSTVYRNDDFWEYDPLGNSWQQKAKLPGPARIMAVGFTAGGFGFLGAGEQASTPLHSFEYWLYDAGQNSWATMPILNSPECVLGGSFSFSDKAFVLMGAAASGAYTTVRQFTPCPIPTPTITAVPTNDTLICAPSGYSYQWNNLPHATTQFYLPNPSVTNYFVTVSNGTCAVTSPYFSYNTGLPGVAARFYRAYHKDLSTPGSSDFYPKGLDTLPDGGYIMAGDQLSGGDIALIRTDGKGDILWTSIMGSTGSDQCRYVTTTHDKGFALAAGWNSSPYNFSIIRTDSLGGMLWRLENPNYEEAYYVEQTKDLGFIAYSKISYGDFYVVKTNSAGTVTWDKTYRINTTSNAVFKMGEIKQAQDGGFLFTASLQDAVTKYNSYLITKLNSSGALVWSNNYQHPQPISSLGGTSIVPLPDNGFMMASAGQETHLSRFNASGIPLWSRDMGLGIGVGELVKSRHGGYFLSGVCNGVAVVRLDYNGDYLLGGCYGTTSTHHIYLKEFVVETKDNGVAMLGSMDGTLNSAPASVLMKLDEKLQATNFCTTSSLAKQPAKDFTFTITPSGATQIANAGPITKTVVNGPQTPFLADSFYTCYQCVTPVANFTFTVNSNTVQFTDLTSYGSSYSWSFGDNSFSSQFNPAHTYSANGTYSVCYTVKNPCGQNTKCQQVAITTVGNLEYEETSPKLSVYPDPADEFIFINTQSDPSEADDIAVFDMTGRMQKCSITNENVKRLDIRHLSPGIYLIRVDLRDGQGSYARFVKR